MTAERTPTHRIAIGTALMAAQDLPAEAGVPEWIHLLPTAQGAIQTDDARGPYHVAAPGQLMAASLKPGDRLPVDENHATDLAAPQGLPAPARGWIVELQARENGIWGRVEWTEAGRALLADRAYRAISPVIAHTPAKAITRILRASLVNRPNFRGLAALNQETPMTLNERLIEKLGLQPGATEDAILAAVVPAADTALQSALAEIGTALGVQGDAAAVVAAARLAGAGRDSMVALQAQVTQLQARLDAEARRASEAYIDGEIRQGRIGLNAATRDDMIALHQAQPAVAEKLIGQMPVAKPSTATATPPAAPDTIALNAAQLEAARLLGVSPADYLKALQSEQESR